MTLGDRDRGGDSGGGTRPRSRLPAAATPAPRLTSSASLKEFESWHSKFDIYRLLVGLDELPRAEQRAALLALLDDDWARVVRFGLPLPTDATIEEMLTGKQHHLRRQRNVKIDRRHFNTRTQQLRETFDEFLCSLTRALLGGRLNAPPPPSGFSRQAKIRRRAAPPGFHPPYPSSFPQLL